MRLPLPPADPALLRAALLTPEGLAAWWAADARHVAGIVSPGLDADTMTVLADGPDVEWRGDVLTARFEPAAGFVTVRAAVALDDADRAELALAWEVALATLGWALERAAGADAPPFPPARWTRQVLPLALAYADAWGRIDGADGLAGGPTDSEGPIRLGEARVPARRRLVAAPRAVVVELDGALIRAVFGPGESVNAATVEAIALEGGALPFGWDTRLAARLGMTWVAQLGEEG